MPSSEANLMASIYRLTSIPKRNHRDIIGECWRKRPSHLKATGAKLTAIFGQVFPHGSSNIYPASKWARFASQGLTYRLLSKCSSRSEERSQEDVRAVGQSGGFHRP